MRRLLPLLLFACAAPDRGNVKIIGHGGAGTEGEHPMNSRMALLSGLELGLAGVELDVQLTADSVLVAYHAEDLGELTDCSGKINANTWGVLRSCPNSASIEPYPIVRLDSLLLEAATRFPKADFSLDCKLFAEGDWWAYLNTYADAIARLDQLPALEGRLIVECQVTDFLRLIETKRAAIDTYLYASDFFGAVDTAIGLHCTGIVIDNARISAEEVVEAHTHGLSVTLFGVGSGLSHREALAKHPDRLQTDQPGAFIEQNPSGDPH